MIERMRESWWRFKASKPGHRFRERYRRNQQRSRGRFDLRRFFNVVVGLAIVLVSIFFGWAPGPGWVTFFIGLGMIAGEFWPAARLLDWAEVEVRKLVRPARRIWTTSSTRGKTLIILVILVCIAALLYGAYSLLFGG